MKSGMGWVLLIEMILLAEWSDMGLVWDFWSDTMVMECEGQKDNMAKILCCLE